MLTHWNSTPVSFKASSHGRHCTRPAAVVVLPVLHGVQAYTYYTPIIGCPTLPPLLLVFKPNRNKTHLVHFRVYFLLDYLPYP